ncbi:MAG: radical SAM protein [Erysipelotrichales bacterium]|nr:radical SAM protein [Erysipelotrichales bacterium]
MKICYNDLQFESTRRCSGNCKHCCRGNAQNIDLTEELVDIFFEKNNIHHIGRFMLSGGEPSLNGHIADYLVDKLIDYRVAVDMFTVAINGLTYSEDLVSALTKLRDYILSTSDRHIYVPGLLLVSQSQYHEDADPKVIKKLSELSYFPKPEKSIIKDEDLLPYGRAYENGLSVQEPNLEELTNYQKNFKVKKYDGVDYLVIEYQYIAANGNVVNDGCQSYDLMDKYALGNIKDETIENIYLKGKQIILK